jgi:hypothetical protein
MWKEAAQALGAAKVGQFPERHLSVRPFHPDSVDTCSGDQTLVKPWVEVTRVADHAGKLEVAQQCRVGVTGFYEDEPAMRRADDFIPIVPHERQRERVGLATMHSRHVGKPAVCR